MDDEEKKALEEAQKKVETVTTPKTTEFTKEPTTQITYNRSAFLNADGTPNTTNEDLFNKNYRDPYAQANGIDPKTGKYDMMRVGELLGFDPAVYEREQREREKLANFKKKEAGWRNALGVIGDIVTSAVGGNVYARKDDGKAKEYAKEEQDAHDNIIKMANSVSQARLGREMKYLEGLRQMRNDFDTKYGAKVRETEGGGTTRVTEGGNKTVITDDQLAKERAKVKATKDALDDKNNEKVRVRYTKKDGSVDNKDIPMGKKVFTNWTKELASHYNAILKEKINGNATDRAKRLRSIMKENKMYDSKNQRIDESMIMRQGLFFELTDDQVKRLQRDLGIDLVYDVNTGLWMENDSNTPKRVDSSAASNESSTQQVDRNSRRVKQ